jgi:hypothetical protein
MATKKENKKQEDPKKDTPLPPDEETLNTTDPQEHMKGPVSSVMQNIKEEAEENDEKDKE